MTDQRFPELYSQREIDLQCWPRWRSVLAALLLGGCASAPQIDCRDYPRLDWQHGDCVPARDDVVNQHRAAPDTPDTPDEPNHDPEPDSATDPEGHREWRDRQQNEEHGEE